MSTVYQLGRTAGLRFAVDREGGLVVEGPDDVIELYAGNIRAEKAGIVETVRLRLKACSVCGASPAKWYEATGDGATWHCDEHRPAPKEGASYAWTDWEGGAAASGYESAIVDLLNECLRAGVLPMIGAHGGLHVANGPPAEFFRLVPQLIARQGEVEAALRAGHGCFDSPSFKPSPWDWAKGANWRDPPQEEAEPVYSKRKRGPIY